MAPIRRRPFEEFMDDDDDKIFCPFDLNSSPVNLDLDPAPSMPAPPRFQPKIKGKGKIQSDHSSTQQLPPPLQDQDREQPTENNARSSPVNLDPDPAPSMPAPPRFQPKIKGKGKIQSDHSSTQLPPPLQDQDQDREQPTESNARTICTPMEENVVEDDDPVVREIDVFFNHMENDAQLYVMQYPLRPSWRPYELDDRCEEVKLKPKNSEVELVLHMDVESENYDGDVPEHMRLEKQTLSSSKATSVVECAAGILIKNQLHLNPIHEVLQFRPCMKHIDDFEMQKRKHIPQEVGSKPHKAKSVLGDLNEPIENAEPWVSLDYNPRGSMLSCKYQQKMMAQLDNNINFTMNPSEYLNSLCPGMSTAKMNPRVPSSSFLPSMPLEERLKEWLRTGRQVNRFDALKHLDLTTSEEDFLKMLERNAFLVQGIWVTNSSLICKGHEALLRDYILFLFSENHVIKTNKLRGLKVNDDSLKRLLRPLAYERPSLNDWKFREERDSSFIKGHLEIVKEQEFAWSTRGKYLTESLSKAGRVQPVMTNKSRIQNMAKTKTAAHKVDTGSNRVDDGSGSLVATSMSNENRESLKKALLHILRDRNARSISSICRELQDYALSISSRPKEDSKTKALVSAIAIVASGPSVDLLSILREVTVEVHNVYVLRSGEHPAYDPFRDVVLGLFRSKGSNAKLKKHEIVEAAKEILKRVIPDGEYRKVLNELCVHNKGAWTLKGVDNPE